jgi:hypothetical protein
MYLAYWIIDAFSNLPFLSPDEETVIHNLVRIVIEEFRGLAYLHKIDKIQLPPRWPATIFVSSFQRLLCQSFRDFEIILDWIFAYSHIRAGIFMSSICISWLFFAENIYS